MGAKRTLLFKFGKRQMKLRAHVIRKVGLEKLILTGNIEGKVRKHRLISLKSLFQLVAVKGLGKISGKILLRAKMDRIVVAVMILHVMKAHEK